jgi:hypothetical protein
VVEIWGIPFCEACAREQEAYFAIGELTQEEEAQGFRSKPLAEALERMRRERAVSRKGIAAKMHQGLSGGDEIEPLALSTSSLQESVFAATPFPRCGSKIERRTAYVRGAVSRTPYVCSRPSP